MTEGPLILVVGASGQIGSRVARGLVERGARVRGISHSDTGAARLEQLHVEEVARADLADPTSLTSAFDGVDRVMLITRAIQDPRQELNVIEASATAGVKRLVKLSSEILYYHWDSLSTGERANPPDMVTALHGPAEDRIRDTGIESVMLRSTWFMSIDSNPLAAAGFARGEFVWPASSAGLALIHPDDVAAVAVECLLGASVPTDRVRLTGPSELSPQDIADGFGAHLNRPISIRTPSPPEHEQWLETIGGMPRHASAILTPFAERSTAPVTDAVLEILGRPARTFADYLSGGR